MHPQLAVFPDAIVDDASEPAAMSRSTCDASITGPTTASAALSQITSAATVPPVTAGDLPPPPTRSSRLIDRSGGGGSGATPAVSSFSAELLDSVPSLARVPDGFAAGAKEGRRPSRAELLIVKEVWTQVAAELTSDDSLEQRNAVARSTTEPVSARVAAAVESIRKLSVTPIA
ncbi:hypothetical protein HK405_015034 [Cladochytrium tenue]|nr:hypothetical protein HK405_015034 [Cladochytrium tenue]